MSVVNRVVSIPLPLAQSAGSGRDGSDGAPIYREAPFLAGPENYLAATAVATFFEPTGNGDPPLVFYGPTGVGKTHLVLGLAAGSRRYYPERVVAYTTAAEFARDVNDAVARKTTVELRRKYRQLDLLVLDGVDTLASKPVAQGELLHTLDDLHNRSGRVVVATRQSPAEMSKLFPALRGRLSQGLVVPVAAPGPEARLELVVQLAAARRIDVAAVRRLTKERASAGGLTLRGIAGAVGKHYRLRLAELRGPSRRQGVVVARGVAVYLARRLTNLSLEQIGHYFGQRDHTTMLHAHRRVEELLETDPGIRQSLGELQAGLEVG
jgi:chromosomal replication initiator protein